MERHSATKASAIITGGRSDSRRHGHRYRYGYGYGRGTVGDATATPHRTAPHLTFVSYITTTVLLLLRLLLLLLLHRTLSFCTTLLHTS
jgi:hypothetical protein